MSRAERKNYITENPQVRDVESNGSITRTYLWNGEKQDQYIFLYLSFHPQDSEKTGKFILCTSNIDSADVRGQGKYIWEFMVKELRRLAEKGLNGQPPIPILHQVSPNEFSLHLVENDPLYQKRGADYFRIFN